MKNTTGGGGRFEKALAAFSGDARVASYSLHSAAGATTVDGRAHEVSGCVAAFSWPRSTWKKAHMEMSDGSTRSSSGGHRAKRSTDLGRLREKRLNRLKG